MNRRIITAAVIYLTLGTLIGIVFSYFLGYILEIVLKIPLPQSGLGSKLTFAILFLSCTFSGNVILDKKFKLTNKLFLFLFSLLSLASVYFAGSLFTFGM